jgi:hypothetical protein
MRENSWVLRPFVPRDVHWTYRPWTKSINPRLACNGIAVRDSGETAHLWSNPHGTARGPTVSVFDPDSLLPLNLTRTALATERLPFVEVLVDDVARDIAAYCLEDAGPSLCDGLVGLVQPRHPAFTTDRFISLAGYIFMNDGYALADSTIIARLGLSRLVFFTSLFARIFVRLPATSADGVCRSPISSRSRGGGRLPGIREAVACACASTMPGLGLNVKGLRVSASNSMINHLLTKYLPKTVTKDLTREVERGRWTSLGQRM